MSGYITLDEAVAQSISILGVGDDNEMAKTYARSWAYEMLLKFPVTEDMIKVCRIYPKNGIMVKPDDMRRYDEMALYDSRNCYIPHVFHAGKKRIYPNAARYPRWIHPDTQTSECGPIDVSEDTQAFYLSSNATDVAYAEVRYFAYPLDKEGMPMIKEDTSLTIQLYVKWKWSMRKNDNRSEVEQNRLMWAHEFDQCKAKLKMAELSTDKAKTMAAIFNRMIPIYNRSRF